MARELGRKAKRRAYRFGLFAEYVTVIYLFFHGYRILARRYKCMVGEIDIIATRGNIIAMIEVKARSDGNIYDVLLPQQQRRIINAASIFIAKHGEFANFFVRFDLVIIAPWRWPKYLKNAWEVTS